MRVRLRDVFGNIDFGGCRIYIDYSGDLNCRLPLTSSIIAISLGMVNTLFTYNMKSRGIGKQWNC